MGDNSAGHVLRGDPAGYAVSVDLLSVYCTPGLDRRSHRHCTGERGQDQLCFCSCHLPGRPVEWQCAHRGPQQQPDDGRSHPVQAQKHPWSFSRARKEWWQRRVK